MSRKVKLSVAAAVTALVATLGTAGVGATMGVVDAGKSISKKDGSWCC